MSSEYEKIVRSALPVYKDWPNPGINYLNTVDICNDPYAFRTSVNWFYDIAATQDIDYIFAADARGFIWASPVAYKIGVPLYTIRKKGKMPGDLLSRDYELEYGTDTLELRKFKIASGSVLIVDDVLATGGTAEAMCKLVHELGVPYQNMVLACLIDITFLPGKVKLKNLGVHVETLIDVYE
jgi:adenine phosphoribosyltransferase